MTAERPTSRRTLALALRRARGYRLLTQDQLADELGIAKRSVAAYEAGTTEPPAAVVLNWLRVCNRPLDDLQETLESTALDVANAGVRSRCFDDPSRPRLPFDEPPYETVIDLTGEPAIVYPREYAMAAGM